MSNACNGDTLNSGKVKILGSLEYYYCLIAANSLRQVFFKFILIVGVCCFFFFNVDLNCCWLGREVSLSQAVRFSASLAVMISYTVWKGVLGWSVTM